MNLNLCVKRRIVFIEKHFYKENAGKRKIALEIATRENEKINSNFIAAVWGYTIHFRVWLIQME